MAPQTEIPTISTVLSTVGTVLWCVQLLPQIWHNWRSKDTTGLPASMMLLWTLSSIPLGVYCIGQNFAIPLQIQPQIFGTFAIVVWAQCLHYGKGWTVLRTVLASLLLWAVCGGVEVMLVLTLRPVNDRGTEWPMILMGVITAIMLVAGFLPAIFEIVCRRGRVLGIHFGFLIVDLGGAVFSLLGVATQNTFDVLGGVEYILVVVIEISILASHIIWLLRTRKLHKRAKEMKVSFDSLPEAKKYQRSGDFSEEESGSDTEAEGDVEAAENRTKKIHEKEIDEADVNAVRSYQSIA